MPRKVEERKIQQTQVERLSVIRYHKASMNERPSLEPLASTVVRL